MIEKIESRQNQKIKDLVRLSNPKYSKAAKLFKIEGFHALEIAKESGLLKCVFTIEEIKNLNVPQYLISEDILSNENTAAQYLTEVYNTSQWWRTT